MDISVDSGLYISMSQTFLNILDRCTSLNQHGGVGVPQRMIIEFNMKFMPYHTTNELERIC